VWLLPSAYDARTLFSEVEAVIETFKAVSGQLYAHFLEQILKHVRAHYDEGVMRGPTVSAATSLSTSTSNTRSTSEQDTGKALGNGKRAKQLHDEDHGHGELGRGQAGVSFNPFETTLGMSGLSGISFGVTDGMTGTGTMGLNTSLGGDGASMTAGADPMLTGLDGLGEDPTFWSWLAGGENTGFSPLVSSLDTLDQSIAMGGI